MTDKTIELAIEVPAEAEQAIERAPRQNEAFRFPSSSNAPCGNF